MNSSLFQIEKIVQLIGKNLRESKSPFDHGAEVLSKYGWYLSSDIKLNDLVNLILLCGNGDINELDYRMSFFYTKDLDKMVDRIITKHPTRKGVILEAVTSHKNKMYYSSTTLFLTQSDGICGTKLFKTKNNRKDHLKKHLLQTNDEDYINKILTPITTVSNLDVYSGNMNENYSNLNRHEIIHGVNTDFGTEINSLKCFSLLCFISDFVDRYS